MYYQPRKLQQSSYSVLYTRSNCPTFFPGTSRNIRRWLKIEIQPITYDKKFVTFSILRLFYKAVNFVTKCYDIFQAGLHIFPCRVSSTLKDSEIEFDRLRKQTPSVRDSDFTFPFSLFKELILFTPERRI